MSHSRPTLIRLSRSLARSYASQLLALINTIPGRPWSPEQLLEKRHNKFRYSHMWLSGARAVGVVIASQKRDSIHIHQVVLDGAFQRQGLGRKAYRQIAAQGFAAGLQRLTACCLLSEEEAIAFHTALGFTLDSRYVDPVDGLEYGRMTVPIATVLKQGQSP